MWWIIHKPNTQSAFSFCVYSFHSLSSPCFRSDSFTHYPVLQSIFYLPMNFPHLLMHASHSYFLLRTFRFTEANFCVGSDCIVKRKRNWFVFLSTVNLKDFIICWHYYEMEISLISVLFIFILHEKCPNVVNNFHIKIGVQFM